MIDCHANLLTLNLKTIHHNVILILVVASMLTCLFISKYLDKALWETLLSVFLEQPLYDLCNWKFIEIFHENYFFFIFSDISSTIQPWNPFYLQPVVDLFEKFVDLNLDLNLARVCFTSTIFSFNYFVTPKCGWQGDTLHFKLNFKKLLSFFCRNHKIGVLFKRLLFWWT